MDEEKKTEEATTEGGKPEEKQPEEKQPENGGTGKKQYRKKKPPAPPEYPWERQVGEPPASYDKFCLYRDMPYENITLEKISGVRGGVPRGIKRERSLRLVAERYGKSLAYLGHLSARYHWSDRAAAYDTEMERRRRLAHEEAIAKMDEAHAMLGSQMVRKALARLLHIQEDDIGAGDIVRMADVGVRIERAARGADEAAAPKANNLLDAIVGGTKDDLMTDDIREIQHPPEPDGDVVE